MSCAALILAACSIAVAGAQQSAILERIIVKVNGEILTQTQLEDLQIEAMRDQNKQVENRKALSNEDVRKALVDITPTILVEEVDKLLMIQRARELNLKFSDEMFKQSIDNIKKQNAESIKSDADLERALKEAGLTMAKLRQNFEKGYLVMEVERREVARNITLTEEEARQYHKAHPQDFMKPATMTLREILVSVPTTGTGTQATFNAAIADAAKAKIDSLRARAAAGEDFLKLISEASDSSTKANNGLIGPVVVADMNPVLVAALEKLQPGEITEPLRTRAGYQIFKLESRSAAEPEPYDKVRNEIGQKIYESRRDGEMSKYLTRLRAQALIEWKDENFRKMYEQGLAKGKSGF
jgi:peptidyl-prolyl cis-trans isomerase SurA